MDGWMDVHCGLCLWWQLVFMTEVNTANALFFLFPCIHLCLLICASTCSVLSGGRLLSGSSQGQFSEEEGLSRWNNLQGRKLDQLRGTMTWFYKALGCLEAKEITHSENENSDSFFLSFLYFSSLSPFNTLLLPPLSAQLSVSLTLTWYLTPQMVQRRTHSSLHLLRSSDRRDSYVPSQHTVVGAHLRGTSAKHTLCRTQRCAWLCEKAFRTHKCPVVS